MKTERKPYYAPLPGEGRGSRLSFLFERTLYALVNENKKEFHGLS